MIRHADLSRLASLLLAASVLLPASKAVFAETAELTPTVNAFPYHCVNFSTDIVGSDGMRYRAFAGLYGDTLNGDSIALRHATATDTSIVVLRQILDSTVEIKDSIGDSASVVFVVDTTLGRPPRHGDTIHFSADKPSDTVNSTELYAGSRYLYD